MSINKKIVIKDAVFNFELDDKTLCIKNSSEFSRLLKVLKPLINKLAYNWAQKLIALAPLYDQDEIEQELTIALLKSVQAYDETRGANFTTYYYNVAFNKVSHIMEKNKLNHFEIYKDRPWQLAALDGFINARHLEERFNIICHEGDEGITLAETLADRSQEHLAEHNVIWNQILKDVK